MHFFESNELETARQMLEDIGTQCAAALELRSVAERTPEPRQPVIDSQRCSIISKYREKRREDLGRDFAEENFDHVDHSPSSPIDARTRLLVEADNYFSEEMLDDSSDPFAYWKKQQTEGKLPILRTLVRKYLSAPATSVESERLFSTAGATLSPLRNRLSDSAFKKLLFLHYNLTIFKYCYASDENVLGNIE
ncbi:hypothetical protein QR680_017871 [Steinernema hermaphroditum]|uniref:HAT C-terminal dimerisation domain-containing protein n=1 Tax=Steinernema hermaphroditum TaxID=289476 RepID=A0AA39HG48_9BILA|nr:hypothetical protein QR680_017871 [Steinernema hermaphroditum]